jgi:hypothetical protein
MEIDFNKDFIVNSQKYKFMTKISKLHIMSVDYLDEYKSKNQIDIVHLFKFLEKIWHFIIILI